MDLHNKVAVVTGASSGLGAAFSQMLVAHGAQVFGLARRVLRLSALQESLGARFHPVACDVREESDVKAAFDAVLREGERLDVLINNAGLGRFGPLDTLAADDWDAQLDTNLRGVFLCTKAALPTLKAQNAATGFGGHIVNIASVAGLVGNANLAAYNATKFGLRGFSEALMKEVRNDGIKVTCVCPGSVDTEFAAVAGASGSRHPMTADDIASTVLHLLEAPDHYLISEVVMRPLRP
jgi:NADP-dependent 3-hydroxy acid dehydrogenase YdfG